MHVLGGRYLQIIGRYLGAYLSLCLLFTSIAHIIKDLIGS